MSGRRFARPLRPPAPLRPDRRRTWPLLALLAPLAAWGGWRAYDARHVAAAERPERPAALVSFNEPIGARTTAARCWMVAIDDSGSMATADSAGTRGDAVLATAEFLAAYGLPDDRLGVTWFASQAEVTDPAPADTATPPAAPTHQLGGGTNIAGALRTTFEAMDRACGDTARVAVLVSDGQASGSGEYDTIAGLLAEHDVALHLVAMNEGGAFDSVRARWSEAVPLRSVDPIDSFAGDDVAAAVAAILSIETGQQVTAR